MDFSNGVPAGLVTLHLPRIPSASGIDRPFSACRINTIRTRLYCKVPLPETWNSRSTRARTTHQMHYRLTDSLKFNMSAKNTKPKEGSPGSLDKYDHPIYYSPKRSKSPPKVWKPFLESFTVFPDFPIEIRQAIWKQTLDPRVVEVKFNDTHGYFSLMKPPVALSICKDSRDAVKYLYPICFGTLIHEPAIVFNFSLDTLYLDALSGPHLLPFVYSLKGFEAQNLQSLAVDRFLDEFNEEFGYGVDIEGMKAVQRATHHMPALKEVLVVVKLDEYWHEHGFPEGDGEIELMESFSYNIQQYMYHEMFHMEDEDGVSECQELPHMDSLLDAFDAPSKSAIWGWRPTELPLEPYPWETLSNKQIDDDEGAPSNVGDGSHEREMAPC